MDENEQKRLVEILVKNGFIESTELLDGFLDAEMTFADFCEEWAADHGTLEDGGRTVIPLDLGSVQQELLNDLGEMNIQITSVIEGLNATHESGHKLIMEN